MSGGRNVWKAVPRTPNANTGKRWDPVVCLWRASKHTAARRIEGRSIHPGFTLISTSQRTVPAEFLTRWDKFVSFSQVGVRDGKLVFYF